MDAVALTVHGRQLQVLTQRRVAPPWEGELALPGVFLKQFEEPTDAVRRALKDKGGLAHDGPLHLVSVENHADRDDPRGWVISLVHLAVVPWWELVEASTEASGVRLLQVDVPWHDSLGDPVDLRTLTGEPATLTFDHSYLIGQALAWLRREAWRTDLLLRLVRDRFTLRQLQEVYEAVLGQELFRTTFRRRMEDTLGLIEGTGEVLDDEPRRPELFTLRR